MSTQQEKVVVTGAAGFIGSHVVQQLLEEGYAVRAAELFPERCTHLQAMIDAGKPLELVQADLLKPETWEPALKGAKYLIHMAAYVNIEVDEKEADEKLIKPAVDGTLNVLKAAAKVGIKRVVLTSSLGAIGDARALAARAATGVPVDSSMWSDPDKSTPYCRSKCRAERAAWDFVKGPEGNSMELVCINPGIVVGPSLSNHCHESMKVILKIVGSKATPEIMLPLVHVKDVAAAHIAAVTADNAVGNRFLLVQDPQSLLDLGKGLAEKYTEMGFTFPTYRLPNFILRIAAFFSTAISRSAPLDGIKPTFDVQPAKEVLGLPERKCFDAVAEMFEDAVTKGHVPSTPAFDEYIAKKEKNTI